MSLPQFGLDHWWPHVVATSRALHLSVLSGAGGVSCGAQNMSLSMSAAPSLAPWAIGRFRDTMEHKKGNVGIQAWISVDVGWISGPRFESCW